MTSKEFIEGVLYGLNELFKEAKKTNDKELILDCETQIGPYIQVLKELEGLEIVKNFVLEKTAFYDNGMCLDEYIYDCEPVAKIFREWEKEEKNES